MIDLNDYKAVQAYARQLAEEDERRRKALLKAADHINAECDRLKAEGKVSANNTERMRIELLGALLTTPTDEIPKSYLEEQEPKN